VLRACALHFLFGTCNATNATIESAVAAARRARLPNL